MNEQTVDLTSGVQPVRENILLGIIGAVLGVLLGAALWVFLGRIGFIAGIAGYAIVFCGMKGYELLGGHLSKGGIILVLFFLFWQFWQRNLCHWELQFILNLGKCIPFQWQILFAWFQNF